MLGGVGYHQSQFVSDAVGGFVVEFGGMVGVFGRPVNRTLASGGEFLGLAQNDSLACAFHDHARF